MFKSDVVEREKLSKAEGRMEVAVQKNRISAIQDRRRGLRVSGFSKFCLRDFAK